MDATSRAPLRVHLHAIGMRPTWAAVPDFAAASRAVREFVMTHDLGGSVWPGGRVVDAATKKAVATVSYNGRVWRPDGTEILLAPAS